MRFMYQDALDQIQASEKELERGLKEKRILILHSREKFIRVLQFSCLLRHYLDR